MILNQALERQWTKTDIPGIEMSDVWSANEDGGFFLRFAEGARFPLHDHNGWEQILMLTGCIRFGQTELNPGDALMLSHGEHHDALALRESTFFVAHRAGISVLT